MGMESSLEGTSFWQSYLEKREYGLDYARWQHLYQIRYDTYID